MRARHTGIFPALLRAGMLTGAWAACLTPIQKKFLEHVRKRSRSFMGAWGL